MALVTLNMSPLGKRVNFTTLLGLTITLFLVLFQAPAAQASNEIAIFLVSKNKNATVEDALLSVPIFGKILGDKLENQTLIIQQKKEENLIFFLGSAKAYPKTRTELSVVSANTEYSFNISSKAFRKRRAKSDEPWKTINLIELYNNDEIKKLSEETVNLKAQLSQQAESVATTKNEKVVLERQLSDAQSQIVELERLQQTVDEERNSLNKQLSDAQSQIVELERLQQTVDEEKKSLSEQLSDAQSQIVELQKSYQAKKNDLVKAEATLKADNKKLTQAANDSSLRVLELEKTIKRMTETSQDQDKKILLLQEANKALKERDNSSVSLNSQAEESPEISDTASNDSLNKGDGQPKVETANQQKELGIDNSSAAGEPLAVKLQSLYENCSNKKNEETCDPLGIFLAERAKSSTVTSECKAQILDMQMALYDYVNEINSNVALAFDKESMSKCFQ